ncbi:MAG: hypothetical protein KDC00_00235 [Flavobacteriales bacterium]|nr:hypothetical protein [Flavobacteriales bacterium]
MRSLLLALVLTSFLSDSLAIQVLVSVVPETCGNANGAAWAYATGGTGPYTFFWTGPNGFTATTDTIRGLEAGNYEVTVTDAQLATAVQSGMVEDLANLLDGVGGLFAATEPILGYLGHACPGECNGAMLMMDDLQSGTPPFTYAFENSANIIAYEQSSGRPVYGGFCANDIVNYTMEDAMGCTGSGLAFIASFQEDQYFTVAAIEGSCTGGTGGSVNFDYGTEEFLAIAELRRNGQLVMPVLDPYPPGIRIVDLAPGNYELHVEWPPTQCSQDLQFTIPDLGTGCGTLTGTSWYDVNADCVRDAGEMGIPNSVLTIEPGGYFALTRNDGSFNLDLPDGNYTLEQTDPTLLPICPAVQPVPFSIGSVPVNIELANGSTQELDVEVWGNSSAARPGFNHTLFARASNLSPQPSGPVTLSITYDPVLTYLDANPAPTSVIGNVLSWEWPAFGSFEDQFVNAQFNIPAGVPIGTVLSTTFTATNTLPEADLANNTVVNDRTVTGSYDPNDKIATTSSRESDELYFINSDEYIDYTIRFQNTGTDTAFTVVITDTLSTDLDMSSFQPGVCSHPCTVDFKAGRVVEWTFTDILLPDSNVNEAASHGLTSFRIKLNEPVVPGTVVENVANIYFDFNEPVITEPSVLVAEFSTGVRDEERNTLHLSPVPATNELIIGGVSDLAHVQVFAIDGRQEIQGTVQGPRALLNVAALASGQYQLVLRYLDGTLAKGRFVKY